MWNKIKKYLNLIFIKYYGLIIVSLFILDIVTKVIMESILKTPGNTIPLIPNLLEFQLVYNNGAFSGWLGGDVGHVILIFISIAGACVIPYLFVKYFDKMNKGMRIGLALALAGDVGNLVDRVIYVNGKPRGVIDFIHFYIPALKFDWPVFNVADICIVVGVICFAVFYIALDIKNEKAKKLENEAKYKELREQNKEINGDKDGE